MGTIDDDDEENDDTDEFDTQSVAESVMSEQPVPSAISRLPSIADSTKSIQTDLSFDIHDNITFVKNNLQTSKLLASSNRSLYSSTRSINTSKINVKDNTVQANLKKPAIPSPGSIIKKGWISVTYNEFFFIFIIYCRW